MQSMQSANCYLKDIITTKMLKQIILESSDKEIYFESSTFGKGRFSIDSSITCSIT